MAADPEFPGGEAIQLGQRAKAAARQLAPLSSEEKNRPLVLL
jgi:hypothetical protein